MLEFWDNKLSIMEKGLNSTFIKETLNNINNMYSVNISESRLKYYGSHNSNGTMALHEYRKRLEKEKERINSKKYF